MGKVTDSILLTVKKMLGIAEEYIAFDIDLVVNINSVFLTLNQLGVGPKEPYRIEGPKETWSDFLNDDRQKFPGVETYVYLKTRLLFDPPTNSFLVDAIQKQCDELEWRLNIQWEGGKPNGNVHDKHCHKRPNKIQPDRSKELELLRELWDKQVDAEGGPGCYDPSRELELLRASWDKRAEMGD